MNSVATFENSDTFGSSTLRSRLSNRARSRLTRMLREPPPKRNDTPLNFNDTYPISAASSTEAILSPTLENLGGPSVGENSSDVGLAAPSSFQSCRDWFAKMRLGEKEKDSLYRPLPGRPVNVPQISAPAAIRRSQNYQSREKALKASVAGHRRVLGNIIPNGLGTILQSVGGRGDRNIGIDIMTVFPAEIITHIFSYLNHDSLLSCELVSRSWYSAAICSQVWKNAFEQEHGKWEGYPFGRDWKSMFEVKSTLRKRWAKGQVTPIYLKGHTDSVYCVQFDSQKIITGSRDRTVRVWDSNTGQCTKVIGKEDAGSNAIGHHKGSILCLQFDSTILVTGSSDHDCIVYELPSYTPILKLPGHRMGVLDVCFDQTYIVSCSKDTTICVWDRATGLLLNRLRGHHGPVNAVQLRGNMLASASGDATIKLWDIETGNCLKTFTGHSRGLACIQFSEDGQTIVSGGNDQSIRVWDVPSGNLKYEIKEAHKSLVRSLYLDSRNGRIVSGSYDQSVRVWDLETGRSLLNFPRWHSSWILAAKADETRIISTSQDSQILMLDFSAGIRRMDTIR